MPKKKPGTPPRESNAGKHATIWIPKRHLKLWGEIENKSAFVSLCLRAAVDIMAWAMLKELHPEQYTSSTKDPNEVIPKFNERFPTNDLTFSRKEGPWHKNSKNRRERW